MTATELVGTWKREAEKALGLRASGSLQLDLYKVVGQREVSCCCCCHCWLCIVFYWFLSAKKQNIFKPSVHLKLHMMVDLWPWNYTELIGLRSKTGLRPSLLGKVCRTT